MSIVVGQPSFFNYDTFYYATDRFNSVMDYNFGNTISIQSNQYPRTLRYDRRYIFTYNDTTNTFILNVVAQSQRPDRFLTWTRKNVFDIKLNKFWQASVALPNNSDSVLNSLPPMINSALLSSLFRSPSSSYRYFLDGRIAKRIPTTSEYANYSRSPFTIKQYYLRIGKYGVMSDSNTIIAYKERRPSREP